MERAFAEERRVVEHLARIGPSLAGELDPSRLMQRLTDEATALVGAEFGAFFYNVVDDAGERFMLHTLAGAPKEAFAGFGMPRNTDIFRPTFAGEGVVRLGDVRQDPRYGKSAPHHGMPTGHLPVVSYLAAPVKGMEGDVLGGLFFGHGRPCMFSERDERALLAITALAGVALENARLFERLKQSEQRARKHERRYILASEAAQEGIWHWDVASQALEWSDRLFELLGMTPKRDLTFEEWLERVHGDDRQPMLDALEAHLRRRTPYRIPLFRLRHEAGDYRWYTTAGQAEWDESGNPLRMAGSVRDVTDKQRAEAELRLSEHRHAQILDSVQDMIFCKDASSALIYANAAARGFFGVTTEKLGSGVHAPFATTGSAESAEADDRHVLRTHEVVERTDDDVPTPTGTRRTFHTLKSPIFNEWGEAIQLVAVARDITETRRQAQAQRFLAEVSAIFSSSLDWERTLANVARAMVPTFADWATVDVLAADGTLARLAVVHADPSKESLARELHRRFPPRMDTPVGAPQVLRTLEPELIPEISDALLAAVIDDPELLAITRSLGLTSSIVVPLVAHGQAFGVISLVYAESGRRYTGVELEFAAELARRASIAIDNARLFAETQKALEARDAALAEVRALASTLERRVEERTAALVEANAELESFSYSVSHDLRAPVRHISGFTDLLRSAAGASLPPKAAEYLATIKNAAAEMGVLIDALLALSRLGRSEVKTTPVDLSVVLGSALAELQPDAQDREIEWSIDPLPTVMADRTMIRLVLVNLLGNALKYTREQTRARIEVGCRSQGHEVTIWVRDNGVGFNMAYVHKLFGVFQRLHSDLRFEGTGIGLATVRRVIARHGGRVWAESELGRGATFYFALPRHEA